MKITEYNETAAALAVLREKYGTVFNVTTPKGMAEAKKARAEVKGYRVALEKLQDELKAPALERTRLIDAEAKRITAALLETEEPIDEAIKAEERRKEEEKAAEEARLNAELEAQQRKQDKFANPPRKDNADDPLADLKQVLNANTETAKALDEAYQRGFKDGQTITNLSATKVPK